MKLKMSDETPYDCPQGPHRGLVIRVVEPNKPSNLDCDEQVRITWKVIAGGDSYYAARTYCADLRRGSDLREVLDTWFEGDLEPFKDHEGMIELNRLIGQSADLLVTHRPNRGHGKPFVLVNSVFKPGTLLPN